MDFLAIRPRNSARPSLETLSFVALSEKREIIRNNHGAAKDFPALLRQAAFTFPGKSFSGRGGRSNGKAHEDHNRNRFASGSSGAKAATGLVSAVRRAGGDDPAE
jgi:hypothetical protein